MSSNHNHRLFFVGASGVGKSAFISCLLGREPSVDYCPTEGIHCYPSNTRTRFYELGGHDSFDIANLNRVKGMASAVIAMYDCSRPKTLVRASNWVLWLRKEAPKIPVFLVGNKYEAFSEQDAETNVSLVYRLLLGDTKLQYHLTGTHDRESQQRLLRCVEEKLMPVLREAAAPIPKDERIVSY